MGERLGACDVCVLLDDDHRADKRVTWCDCCDAWICDECGRDWIRRGLAWLGARLR